MCFTEKNCVDPCAHYDLFRGLKALCGTLPNIYSLNFRLQKDGVVLLTLQLVNILATCLMEVNFMDIVKLMEFKLHLVMFKIQTTHQQMKMITPTHQARTNKL